MILSSLQAKLHPHSKPTARVRGTWSAEPSVIAVRLRHGKMFLWILSRPRSSHGVVTNGACFVFSLTQSYTGCPKALRKHGFTMERDGAMVSNGAFGVSLGFPREGQDKRPGSTNQVGTVSRETIYVGAIGRYEGRGEQGLTTSNKVR